MKWVGLTGGIGTGKSTVSHILHQKGVPVLSADVYTHETLKQKDVVQKLLSHFGKEILSLQDQEISEAVIDRKVLGDIAFTDPNKKLTLENILHPIVKDMMNQRKKQLEQLKTALAICEIPLLFEQNIQAEFDFVLLVAANREVIYERLKKSRSLTKRKVDLIIHSQMPQEEKLKLTPFVIWNNGTIRDLEKQCDHLIKRIIP